MKQKSYSDLIISSPFFALYPFFPFFFSRFENLIEEDYIKFFRVWPSLFNLTNYIDCAAKKFFLIIIFHYSIWDKGWARLKTNFFTRIKQ